jgi:hypothetical protein
MVSKEKKNMISKITNIMFIIINIIFVSIFRMFYFESCFLSMLKKIFSDPLFSLIIYFLFFIILPIVFLKLFSLRLKLFYLFIKTTIVIIILIHIK